MAGLPDDGRLEIGSFLLDGRQIAAGPDAAEIVDVLAGSTRRRVHRPVVWVTLEPVAAAGDAWLQLRSPARERNLVPFLIDPDDDHWLQEGDFDVDGRAESWEFDARSVLEHCWETPEDGELDGGDFERPSTFPGLAPATSDRIDIAQLEDLVRETKRDCYVAFVVGERQGDVPAKLGWTRHNTYRSGHSLTTVLWSWESRFGAMLVEVGYETLDVFVSRPVADPETAWLVACEHHAFCPDIIDQGVGSIEAYAEELSGSLRWSFWWD